MIPREDLDLAIPSTEGDDAPEAELEGIPDDLAPAVTEAVEADLNQPSTSRSDHANEDKEFQFVSLVHPRHTEDLPVIYIFNEPGTMITQLNDDQEKTVIKITTGMDNKTPAYKFSEEEKIEVVVQDICGCRSGPSTPKTTRQPLVDAGIISPELESVFTPLKNKFLSVGKEHFGSNFRRE